MHQNWWFPLAQVIQGNDIASVPDIGTGLPIWNQQTSYTSHALCKKFLRPSTELWGTLWECFHVCTWRSDACWRWRQEWSSQYAEGKVCWGNSTRRWLQRDFQDFPGFWRLACWFVGLSCVCVFTSLLVCAFARFFHAQRAPRVLTVFYIKHIHIVFLEYKHIIYKYLLRCYLIEKVFIYTQISIYVHKYMYL